MLTASTTAPSPSRPSRSTPSTTGLQSASTADDDECPLFSATGVRFEQFVPALAVCMCVCVSAVCVCGVSSYLSA